MFTWNQGMTVLGIGAHYDDVELNALGTILRLQELYDANVYLMVCTNSLNGGSMERHKEQYAVDQIIKYKKSIDLLFQDGELMHNSELVSRLEYECNVIQPDLIITHTEDDFHQDHIAVAKAVRAVNRYSQFSVLSFSSQDPKQLFLANLHVDITDYFDAKLEILKLYESQKDKPWLDEQTIKSRNAGIGGMQWSEKFNVQYLKI